MLGSTNGQYNKVTPRGSRCGDKKNAVVVTIQSNCLVIFFNVILTVLMVMAKAITKRRKNHGPSLPELSQNN